MNRREFLSLAAQCVIFAGAVAAIGGVSVPTKAQKSVEMTQWVFDGVNGLRFGFPSASATAVRYKTFMPIARK